MVAKQSPFEIFNAKTIAVIGASGSRDKLGNQLLRRAKAQGYQTFAINPSQDKVEGHKSHQSISQVRTDVDLVLIATPAFVVPLVLRECAEKGVKHAVVYSSGFSDKSNGRLEEQLKTAIHWKSTRVIGPNSFGIISPHSKMHLAIDDKKLLPGHFGFLVSSKDSEKVLSYLADNSVGVSKYISYGTGVDVSVPEMIQSFNSDKYTSVICLALDKISNAEEFTRACRKSHKPIVCMLSDNIDSRKRRLYSGALKQAGVKIVKNISELADAAHSR